MPPAENRDTKQGFLLAGAAYLLWGFLPFYMKALAHVPSWKSSPIVFFGRFRSRW